MQFLWAACGDENGGRGGGAGVNKHSVIEKGHYVNLWSLSDML